MKPAAAVILLLVLSACIVFSLDVAKKFGYLLIAERVRAELDGEAVHGELLIGQADAFLTIRQSGRRHTYWLVLAGDIDQTGDMGEVIYCRDWIAPRFPFYIFTHHPPCEEDRSTGPHRVYQPLLWKGRSMQFSTTDGHTVFITR